MTATLKPAAEPSPLFPPDESTWRRYSAHKEGEMSWATSGAVHILVVGVLIALGVLWNEQRQKPPTNEGGLKNLFRANRQAIGTPVVMSPTSTNAPGKGNPDGPGGVAALGGNRPEAADPGVAGEKVVDRLTKLDPLQTQNLVSKLPDYIKNSPDGKRLVETGEADEQLLGMRNLHEKVTGDLNALRRAQAQRAAVGEPTPGSPDGSTTGKPGDSGDPTGGLGGSPPRTESEKRNDRWNLDFDLPRNPQYVDMYLRQLDALGIFIALPTDAMNKMPFRVIHKLLQRPVTPVAEDPSRLNNLHWIQVDPQMSVNVANHLGVAIPYGYIIMMPKSLEETMAKLEREKLPPGARTDDIARTFFKVVRNGDRFNVVFVNMRMK